MELIHPGEYLARTMEQYGYYNQTQLAKALNTNQPVVSRLLNGQLDVTVKMSLKFENATGKSALDWLTMQLEYTRQSELRKSRISVPEISLY